MTKRKTEKQTVTYNGHDISDITVEVNEKAGWVDVNIVLTDGTILLNETTSPQQPFVFRLSGPVKVSDG